jgi:hypothetical protein
MDINIAVVSVVLILAVVHIFKLAIIEKGDFEAYGRTGKSEFSIRAKERKSR